MFKFITQIFKTKIPANILFREQTLGRFIVAALTGGFVAVQFESAHREDIIRIINESELLTIEEIYQIIHSFFKR
jgi:hypothetical protein